MQIVIDTYVTIPIYEQIVEQIETQILNGTIPSGQALPSIRALANELKVSVITTKRAYEVLEQKGWVVMIPQRGTLVCPLNANALKQKLGDEIKKRYRELIEYSENAGFSREQLHDLIKEEEEKND